MKVSEDRSQNIKRLIQQVISITDVVLKVAKNGRKDCLTRLCRKQCTLYSTFVNKLHACFKQINNYKLNHIYQYHYETYSISQYTYRPLSSATFQWYHVMATASLVYATDLDINWLRSYLYSAMWKSSARVATDTWGSCLLSHQVIFLTA